MPTTLEKFGQLLNDLNRARTKDSKTKTLKREITSDSSPLLRLWQAVLHPYISYGISKIPAGPPPSSTVDGPVVNEFSYLIQLLDNLANRVWTGHNAQAIVFALWSVLNPVERRGFKAIIERKAKCGVSIQTINEIFPGTIPTFQLAKADSWKHREDHARALCNKGAIVEKKENGERRLYIRDKNLLLTSNGNADDIWPSLNAYLMQVIPPGVVIDGELVLSSGLYDIFHYTRTEGKQFDLTSIGGEFVIFDVLPVSDWYDQRSAITQHIRSNWVQTADFGPGPVRAVQHWRVSNAEEMDTIYLNLIRDGLEGIVVKDPSAIYPFRRNKCWVKRKLEGSEDLPILQLLPGEPGGKYEFTLGRIVVNYKGKEVKVSPGRMSDDERDEIWANPENYIGKVIEVIFQEETPDGSLQHPRFKRFREDKV